MNKRSVKQPSGVAGARDRKNSRGGLNSRLEARPKKTGASALTGNEKTFRVLVVDDNLVDQELAVLHMSQTWPFERELELDFAADGAEALAKLYTKTFALVVLDWMLPVLGEGEVLRQLRQNGHQIPVVVVSGREREEITDDLDSLQASFLNKNQMNPDTFQLAIGHALALLKTPATAQPSPC